MQSKVGRLDGLCHREMASVWKQRIYFHYHIDLMMLEHGKTKHFLHVFTIMVWQTKNSNILSLAILILMCCNCIVFQCYDVFMCNCENILFCISFIMLEITYH